MPRGSSSAWYASSARAMPSAACTARTAWSSCAIGAPKIAMMPSPRNWLTVPS